MIQTSAVLVQACKTHTQGFNELWTLLYKMISWVIVIQKFPITVSIFLVVVVYSVSLFFVNALL